MNLSNIKFNQANSHMMHMWEANTCILKLMKPSYFQLHTHFTVSECGTDELAKPSQHYDTKLRPHCLRKSLPPKFVCYSWLVWTVAKYTNYVAVGKYKLETIKSVCTLWWRNAELAVVIKL